MTKTDTQYPKESTVPPDEEKSNTALRLYQADVDLLRELYPESLSQPVRRLVRKLADKHRKERNLPVRGQPAEADRNQPVKQHWLP